MVCISYFTKSIDLPKLIKITSIETNTVRSYTISSTEKQQPKTILQGNFYYYMIIPRCTSIKRN